MTFQVCRLSNVIKQDVYVLHTKYRRSFSSMSQSSNELIIQDMVIARNRRLAERFLVLLRCGLLQRPRFFHQNVQPTSGSGFLEIPQIVRYMSQLKLKY